MAQYKVPQDVEADDKLLGPFTFRQFIYLIVAAGSIALAWALYQVFPLLVILPLPVIIFFSILALPIKKDQPMETYLAAIVSFYLKPHKRFWESGQPESTIRITAPKKAEASRTKDITGDEATHRLSFLANIVDSEGHAIKDAAVSPLKDEFYAEASNTPDMFEISAPAANKLEQIIQNESTTRHDEIVKQMRAAIEETKTIHDSETPTISRDFTAPPSPLAQPTSSAIVTPSSIQEPTPPPTTTPSPPTNVAASQPAEQPPPELVNLAENTDISVETIAKEANRLEQKRQDGEVYVSLH